MQAWVPVWYPPAFRRSDTAVHGYMKPLRAETEPAEVQPRSLDHVAVQVNKK